MLWMILSYQGIFAVVDIKSMSYGSLFFLFIASLSLLNTIYKYYLIKEYIKKRFLSIVTIQQKSAFIFG